MNASCGADRRESVIRDAPIISNLRHLGLVEEALAAVDAAIETAGAGAAEELILAELAPAREALEAITGRRTADDVLRQSSAGSASENRQTW